MTRSYEDLIQKFDDLHVTVVGDLMLDRYLIGHVRRISPEAPVPVVEVERTFERPGGAGNVAANVRRLGARTTLIGVVGDDPDGQRLRDALASIDVPATHLITLPCQPTTVKTRIVAHGQQIVRVDRERPLSPDPEMGTTIRETLAAGSPDVVILSDYAKGALSRWVCSEVLRHCQRHDVPVVVDPKGHDYHRYVGATAITPNEQEAAQALGLDGRAALDFGQLRRFFLDELGLAAALVTQGERGMSLLLPGKPPLTFRATARDVADVTGAGDTVASVFSLALAAGATFVDASHLANVAAGVVVGKAGAVAISPADLLAALHAHARARTRRTR